MTLRFEYRFVASDVVDLFAIDELQMRVNPRAEQGTVAFVGRCRHHERDVSDFSRTILGFGSDRDGLLPRARVPVFISQVLRDQSPSWQFPPPLQGLYYLTVCRPGATLQDYEKCSQSTAWNRALASDAAMA